MEEKDYSKTTPEVVIRKAGPDDLQGIHDLVKELAHYERAPGEVSASVELYRLNFKDGVFDCLVAEMDGDLVGIALYYLGFSTWKGKMMFLEDFIITKQHRRHGIGRLLFEAFLDECRKADVQLAKWQVLDWNAPAIQFYKKYDSKFEDGWLNVKVSF